MINVYISYPYSDDPVGNTEKVKKIVQKIAQANIKELENIDAFNKKHGLPPGTGYDSDALVCPVCPHLAFPAFMSEEGGIRREHALAFCLSLVRGCDEVWVCHTNITSGIKEEITLASELGRLVRWRVECK